MKPFSLILATYLTLCSSTWAKTLNISTFNIKWFGQGGEISGKDTDEYRTPWITEFIKTNLDDQDVMVFQEIVNLSHLSELVKNFGMNCVSYNHPKKGHQKVAICFKNKYSFEKPSFDNNYTIEEVGEVYRGNLRPAVYGTLIEKKSRKKITSIVAVHLKASWNHTDTRLEQAEIIKNKVQSFSSKLPMIILGDFNTYRAQSTRLDKDDAEYINEVFKTINLNRVEHNYASSFRSSSSSGLLLDHAWVSRGVKVKDVQITKACNSKSRYSKRFDHVSFYNRFVSDHCPLSMKVEL